MCLYLYPHPNISMGFQIFLKACYGAKGEHRDGYGASLDLRSRDRCVEVLGKEKKKNKKKVVWRFLHHKQKRGVQWLFLSTVNPFSQEISRLFFKTEVSDSSNNLLINNKEAFSRRDYNQACFVCQSYRERLPLTFKTSLLS